MMRCKFIFPTIAALATAASAQVIIGPGAQANPQDNGAPVFIQGGNIRIQGNVQIQVQGGGVIIFGGGGIMAQPEMPFTPDQLPIVSSGFASDADVQGPITPLLEALRSSNFIARENATQALLRLPPARLDQVVEALASTTDPESIDRLTQAAAHLYLKPRTLLRTPGRFMGYWNRQPGVAMLGLKFRMDPVRLKPADADPTMTAIVTEIQPGFPSMQILRNGDRIIAIDDIGFPGNLQPQDSDYFRRRVMSRAPGSQVPMTILRDGKVFELKVQMAGIAIPENADLDRTVSTVIQMRAAGLDAFLHSLKTGDKSPVLITATPVPRPQLMMVNDAPLIWEGIQPLVPAADPPPDRN